MNPRVVAGGGQRDASHNEVPGRRWASTWAPRPEEHGGDLVDDTMAGAHIPRLLQLTDPTCPLDEAAASLAARYVLSLIHI